MKSVLGILFLLSSICTYGQKNALNGLKVYSVNELKEDLAILKGSLEDYHPGLYMYRTKKGIDLSFNRLIDSIDSPLNELEFYRKIAPFISFIGCGHTYVELPGPIKDNLRNSKHFIPIDVSVIGQKIYCIRNNTLDGSIEPGYEILSINGISADSIIAIGTGSIRQDGVGDSGKFQAMKDAFREFYADFIGQPISFTFEYLDSMGNQEKILMDALSNEEIAHTRKADMGKPKDPRNMILEYTKNPTIAILTVKHFFDWEENGKKIYYVKRLQEIFEDLDRIGPDHLIIDIRNNGGGMQPWRLSAYLHDKPLRYAKQASFIYDRKSRYTSYHKLHPSMKWLKHKNLNRLLPGSNKMKKLNDSTYLLTNLFTVKNFKPLLPQFKGKVYVLLNGGSFSAASWFAAIVKSNALATTIGQETSGGYFGQTSMAPVFVTLPNTKLVANIPLVNFEHDVDTKKNRTTRGVIPDHTVPFNLQDIIDGVDTEMNFTLDMIERASK